MSWFLETAIVGLTGGAIYALIAMGYNVIFATTGVLNFAHGEFFMGGMMLGAFLFVSLGLPVLVALGLTVLAAAVVAVAEERIAVRSATKTGQGLGSLGWVLSTLGVGIIIRSGFTLTMGPQLRTFPDVIPLGSFRLFGAVISAHRVLLIVTALAVGALLYAFLERSLLGRALGAVEQDPDAAHLRGIPVVRLGVLAFAIGGGLAAFVGFLAAPLSAAVSSVGLIFGLKGFIAAAAGGIPSIKGALIAGFGVGLLEVFGASYLGAGYRDAIVFAALLLILFIRPSGLFGSENVRAV
ncbi:branched-chain amino acid ABC transporter permease [Euzebya sp.]|uniref:branched-chain amino acid ABC transporter permease n=1 Tax=Euzebya sp. TaxID=1971409 RepID=UPI0035177365